MSGRKLTFERLDSRLTLTAGFVFEGVISGLHTDHPPDEPVVLKFLIEGSGHDDVMSIWTNGSTLDVLFETTWEDNGFTGGYGGIVDMGDIQLVALTYLVSPANATNPLLAWAGFEMRGLGGDDQILGHDIGSGRTLLYDRVSMLGGNGNDNLVGGAQSDILDGGSGDDQLNGFLGADRAFGGVGDDIVLVDPFDVSPNDESGHDVIFGNNASYPGMGIAISNNGFEEVYGTDEQDYIDSTGYSGTGYEPSNGLTGVVVLGQAGDDIVVGSMRVDKLDGGLGDDVLEGRFGGDELNGGGGFDIVSYASSLTGVDVSFEAGFASRGDAEGDILIDLEGIRGSRFDDILQGDTNSNELTGLEGNDHIDGRGGDDEIFGGDGDDTLFGGLGNDVLWGGIGRDSIYGEIGADHLDGGQDADKLDGGAGMDALVVDYWMASGPNPTPDDELFGGPDADEFRLVKTGNRDSIPGGVDPDRATEVLTFLAILAANLRSDFSLAIDVALFSEFPD